MVDEARLEPSAAGLAPVTDGWFVVNVRDAAWVTSDAFGADCIFEGDDAPFADAGFTLCVLRPGQPNGMYHSETNQEDFLVLAGECLRSSRARSGRSKRGTSCTARRAPSTSSSGRETARASSS